MCNREAPSVEEAAQKYRDSANFVGVAWTGDDDAPGGDFQGYLYFYRGRWDQQLMGGFGLAPTDLGATPEEAADTTPPYRGQVMLSLRQWYCAQPSLPLISVVVTNPITIPGYETETSSIGADQVIAIGGNQHVTSQTYMNTQTDGAFTLDIGGKRGLWSVQGRVRH